MANNDNFAGSTAWLSENATPADGPANYADEAAAATYVRTNLAADLHSHWIWFDESDTTLKKGLFIPYVPEIPADPLVVNVDLEARTIAIDYAPVARALVLAPDSIGAVDDLLYPYFHRGLRTEYFGTAGRHDGPYPCGAVGCCLCWRGRRRN